MDSQLNTEEYDPPPGWLFYLARAHETGLIYFVMMTLPHAIEYFLLSTTYFGERTSRINIKMILFANGNTLTNPA